MAHTVTVLTQGHNEGLGLVTVGRLNLSSTYATGGEDATTSLQAKLSGFQAIDAVFFAYDDLYTAVWDRTLEKVRIFKIAAGVMTEVANGASYDANISIPFVCYSRQ